MYVCVGSEKGDFLGAGRCLVSCVRFPAVILIKLTCFISKVHAVRFMFWDLGVT